MESKDNMKRAAAHIKILVASKAAPANIYGNISARVPHKNKSRTGVLLDRKHQGKKIPSHKGSQFYCVLYKKGGIPDHKDRLHCSENCLVTRS